MGFENLHEMADSKQPARKCILRKRPKGNQLLNQDCLESPERSSEAVDYVYNRYFSSLSNSSIRIDREKKKTLGDMLDYVDSNQKGYSKNEIIEDRKEVIRLRTNDSEDSTSNESEMLEYFFSDSNHGIFNDFEIIPAHEFDDRFNHTDAVGFLPFIENGKRKNAPLAFDFTISNNEEVLEKKREMIAKELLDCTLTSIKYIACDNGDFGLNFVPRVIINFSKKGVANLCKIIVDNEREFQETHTLSVRPDVLRALKRVILMDIKSQLEIQLQVFLEDSPINDILSKHLHKKFQGKTQEINYFKKRTKEGIQKALEGISAILDEQYSENKAGFDNSGIENGVVSFPYDFSYCSLIASKFGRNLVDVWRTN